MPVEWIWWERSERWEAVNHYNSAIPITAIPILYPYPLCIPHCCVVCPTLQSPKTLSNCESSGRSGGPKAANFRSRALTGEGGGRREDEGGRTHHLFGLLSSCLTCCSTWSHIRSFVEPLYRCDNTCVQMLRNIRDSHNTTTALIGTHWHIQSNLRLNTPW